MSVEAEWMSRTALTSTWQWGRRMKLLSYRFIKDIACL